MLKLSVIIPIYNVEPYIEQCLKSICNQTLRDIEIICVDDCGNDNSMNIVKRFAAKDSRIKIVRNKQNSGLSASRNNGVKHSHGKYIMFCDSDDWFAPDMCEKMLDAITSDDADMAICGTDVIYEANGDLKESDDKYFAIHHTGTVDMTMDIQNQYNVCAWNKIYRREIMESHNVWFPAGLKYEDNYFFHAYCPWVRKIAFVNDKLYKYRRRAGSIMNSTYANKQINLDPLKIAIAYYEYLAGQNIWRGRENWYWQNIFYVLFCNTLQYSNSKYHNQCYDAAIKFIKSHYDDKVVDFYTRRSISQILSRTLYKRKILGNIIKSEEDTTRKHIRLCGLKIYTVKYSPTKTKYYIAGMRVYHKNTRVHLPKCRAVQKLDFDDSQLLQELHKIGKFTYIPNPGNIGDMLIAAATYQFFKKYSIKFKQFNQKKCSRYIVYGGGGIWTRDYENDWIKNLPIFQRAEKIIILPSSFNNCQKLIDALDERFVVFCREKRSYEYMKSANTGAKILLDHDMAFRLEKFPTFETVSGAGIEAFNKVCWGTIPKTAYFMRQDRESVGKYKTDMDVSDLTYGLSDSKPDWINFCAALMLAVVDSANTVITDRLHVAIAGLLMGKNVYMLDNSYGKLSGVYNHSMKKYKNVHFCKKMPKL